jgi:Tol biopolymer transport system component
VSGGLLLKIGERAVVLMIVLTTFAACTALPNPNPSHSPLPPIGGSSLAGGLIAYTSMRDNQPALYVVTPDGAKSTLLFQSQGSQAFDGGHVSWSPVTGRLAFSVIGKERVDIYTSLPDGSDLRNVTGSLKQGGTDPVWSPDGRRLLFACTGQSPQICAIDEDGSNLRELTGITGAQSAVFPSWSPDGRQIAYQSNRSGLPGIHIMNADGSKEQRLSGGISPAAQNTRPSWAPDGKRILFQSDRDGQWRIYAMDASGNAPTKISKGEAGADLDAAWSPDGNKVAYRSERAGEWSLVLANADGTDSKTITPGKGGVLSFSWAPDSEHIAYAANVDGNSEIKVVDLVTQEIVNISHRPAADMAPLWLKTK